MQIFFQRQKYSFLPKKTTERRTKSVIYDAYNSLLEFFVARYGPIASSFVEFHTPIKVYPNDERCESLCPKNYGATVRLSRSVPKKGCANPSRVCVT